MCGFSGFIDQYRNYSVDELARIVDSMTNTLLHRGPDDRGNWVDREIGFAVGHRRLSIVDLSIEGHQPMISACGRYVIAFNGEIYNYHNIRKELDATADKNDWRGHSDTEVMLAAISHWGVDKSIASFIGMFSFVLWDRKERILYLARDRMGEKPLYYGWSGKAFLFGSELKALREHPSWAGEIDRNALALMLRHNYIPAPYSIYKGINKLLPGTIVRIKVDSSTTKEMTSYAYWSTKDVVETGAAKPITYNEAEAANQLESILKQAVSDQMLADVPLGAFLSGGVDSSTIVALMQAQSSIPVKTFTIGFNEQAYDEAKYAKAVAKHLGTEHTELYVSPDQAMAVIPRLSTLYDEPFSDPSQIPTFLVSQLARRHVTVCLSGDAGDELFAGYNRYLWGMSLWQKIKWIPLPLRSIIAKGIMRLPPRDMESVLAKLNFLLSENLKQRNPVDKLYKIAEILDAKNPQSMYMKLVSQWKSPETIVLNAHEPTTVITDNSQQVDLSDYVYHMMYLDMMSYLPDDILVKLDRASMAVSLESRIPFLDHRVVEFASRLPLSMKIKNGQGKWLLRQVLYRHVPKELIERPKMGFAVPIDSWLRGPLHDWANELLDPKLLREQGYFETSFIREKWNEHITGKRNWQYYLWTILMFQSWHACN